MAYWFFKAVLSPLFFLLWRVRVEGRRQVPGRGAAILASNHQSFCDSLFIPLVLRRRVTFLAKAEYFDSLKTAWFFRSAGQIPIRRGGGDVSERALETAKEVLSTGKLLALYPEGNRSRDGRVHRGHTGVARLAAETGVPVIPVGVRGTEAVQPIGRNLMRPFRPVSVRFGAPRYARPPVGCDPEAAKEALRSFTDELMRDIAALASRPYVDAYAPIGAGRDTAAPRNTSETSTSH